MEKYCTKCGEPLNEQGKCPFCPQTNKNTFVATIKSLISQVLSKIRLNNPFGLELLSNDEKIVPNEIKENEGEIPIKQYRIASLRSRIRGQYAKGLLQITNKRLIFRASGLTYTGRVAVQHEFAIDNIAGVEVKKSNRISTLNIILSIILAINITPIFANVFNGISQKTEWLALSTSILFAIGCIVPFFLLKKKFWLKLLITSCGFGAVIGTASLVNLSAVELFFGFNLNIADFVSCIMLIVWLINMILVSLVPELAMIIKTEGATEAIVIRRKQFATIFKQEIEYTGFSEVLPGLDIDVFSAEVGAIIKDIQTLGDVGIDNWKEN